MCVYIYVNFCCTFILRIGAIIYPKLIYLDKYFSLSRNNRPIPITCFIEDKYKHCNIIILTAINNALTFGVF